MKNNLSNKKCKPCEGGIGPLQKEDIDRYISILDSWTTDYKQIEKIFRFKNFDQAICFINEIASLANEEGHHPDILLFGWNNVKIILKTHSIDGLSENDFIVASKTDYLYRNKFEGSSSET